MRRRARCGPGRGRHRAVLRPRHHRPGRAPGPRRADLAVTARGPVAVASGHPATTAAAVEVLAAGGNAIDACVAAGFAAAVAEPTLTSLGGGGFLLARTAAGEEVLFDFFVDTPGLGAAPAAAPLDFEEVVVRFSGADQAFHVGLGLGGRARAASPAGSTPTGRLGRLDLDEVIAPARRLADARRGGERPAGLPPAHPRADPHPHPEAAASIVAPGGRLLLRGDRLVNPDAGRLPRRARRPRVRGAELARGDRRRHGRRRRAADGRRPRPPTRSSSEPPGRHVARPPPAHEPAARVRRRAGRARSAATSRSRARLAGRPRFRGPRRRPRRRPWWPPRRPAAGRRPWPRRSHAADPPAARRTSASPTPRATRASMTTSNGEGSGLAHPRHRRHGQQHDGRGRPPPRRLPRRGARAAGGVDDGAVGGRGTGGRRELVVGQRGLEAHPHRPAPGDRGRGRPAAGPSSTRWTRPGCTGTAPSSTSSPAGRPTPLAALEARWPLTRWDAARPLLRRRPRRRRPDGRPPTPRRGGSTLRRRCLPSR